ncbi:TOMM precursor leader peptide-binding protein [Streptomyces sp. NBC_01020]|uniref:TOMM precursor leader peptide-binding protein n=1 Tax=unclassified Streptomyces TaxID=2593676 RepID=UPI00324F4EF2|nr:TOMM precursor leader peptide-binding protein [Streptomyces sp. NBC_01020]WSX65262.1 TOMM precursor leader peptide-binding protein [Streptomyces sp. NBC_00932]
MTDTPQPAATRVHHDGGLLGQALARRTATAPPPRTGTRLLATDTPDAASETARELATGGHSFLLVVAELDRVVIGPLVRPGTPGCHRCLATRRAGARTDAAEEAALHTAYGSRLTGTVSPLLTPIAADLAAHLALNRLSAAAATEQAVTMVRLTDLEITRHLFLPDPHCHNCGSLPDDSPARATVPRVPRPKPDPEILRLRDLRTEQADLEARYADDETGVLKGLRTRGLHTLPFAEAKVGPPESVDGGYGRALDFRTAKVTAIAEALERLGGGRPGGRRTVVHGSHRELTTRHPGCVLDPATTGSHEPHRYQEPGFPFQPYHPDLVLPWVWGYSLTREQPVLVPESLAYYRLGRHHPQTARPFVSEISNGCALGGCIEEAALYGLLELAERDAFLLTWYARMPAPALDLHTASDQRIGLLTDRIQERTGYRVEVFDVTGPENIPCFWAAAIDTQPPPTPGTEPPTPRPSVLCAGGSGLDPERGIFGALHELVTAIEAYQLIYPQRAKDAARMREDPHHVRLMDDHALLYCDPVAAHRLDFLLNPDNRPPQERLNLRELAKRYAWPRHTDLRADLDELVGRYATTGLETIVIDQTTPAHTASTLSCVKVLVPGLLPMTFGHHLRRITGLDRALTVSHHLGHTTRPLRPEELNPHPHPFP